MTYWLKEDRKDEPGKPAHAAIKLEIYDAQGQLVRTLSSVVKPNRYAPDDADEPNEEAKPDLTTDAGINRVQWDLSYEGARRLKNAKVFPAKPDSGPMVLPGEYTLRLTVDGKTQTATATVQADPRSPVTPEQLQQNVAFQLQARAALDRLNDDIEDVRAMRAQAEDLRSRTASAPASKQLHELAETVATRSEQLESRMYNAQAEVGYDVLAGRDDGGVKLYGQMSNLYAEVGASDRAPTQGQTQQLAEDLAELKMVEDQLNALRAGDLARLEEQSKSLGLPRVILPSQG